LYNENQEALSSICRSFGIACSKSIMTQYIWRVKTRLPERFMTQCQVLARGRLNACLVEFADGYRVITSRNYLIKLEAWQKGMGRRSIKREGQSKASPE
jgi:hypothetical protein